jgi:hypothetical protein
MNKKMAIAKAAGKKFLKDGKAVLKKAKKYVIDRPLDNLIEKQEGYYTKPNAKQKETLKKYYEKL